MSTLTYRKRQAESALKRFEFSRYESIFSAYGKPSCAKIRAFQYCVETCEKYNGFKLRILSKNTFMFTCGFFFYDKDGKKQFYYITPSYDVFIPAKNTFIV